MDDHNSRRYVKQDDCGQPEYDVRGAELRCVSDPGESDNVQNLRQHQVGQAKLFLQFHTVEFDQVLGFEELLLLAIDVGHEFVSAASIHYTLWFESLSRARCAFDCLKIAEISPR
jgi:hypothetical protein